MKKTTKMMMMNTAKDRKDLDREHRGLDLESRFRDDRGREHYDNGRYAPARNEYIPAYGYHDQYGGSRDEKQYPFPVYERHDREWRSDTPMNKIGFSLEGEMERKNEMEHDYRSDAGYHGVENEMSHRRGNKMSGYASRDNDMHLTKEMANEWTGNMENANGTTGAHFTFEHAQKIMAEREIEGSPIDFYVTLNMMYSDYCEVAKKFGVSNLEFYVCMAKAFLDDKDARPDKLARYYEYIVK